MTDQITFKEIQDAAAALGCSEIRTLEDLRKCLSQDVDESIVWLSKQTKVNHPLLLTLLVAEFDDDASLSGKRKLPRYWRSLQTFPSLLSFSRSEVARLRQEKKGGVIRGSSTQVLLLASQLMLRQRRLWSNWRRYWPDALVLVILPLLLLFLAFRAQSINNRSVRYVTVQQGATVGGFQRLTDNLVLTNVPYAKGAFTSIDEVRGRYTLENLPGGSTLSSNQVLSSELSSKMAGRIILSVPIKAGSYVSTMKTPCEAIMVLSPRKEDGAGGVAASFDVIVLRFDKAGETTSAIVGIQKDQFDKASSLLGSHDVLLAQTPR